MGNLPSSDVTERPSRARLVVLAFLCSLSFVLYLDRVCIAQAVTPIEREMDHVPFESLPRSARYRMGRRERIAAHAARRTHVHERHRPTWQLEFELFFARHGELRGILIVAVFAAISGLAVFVDLSPRDPFGPGLGWSPGLVIVAFLAAYVLNRSHSEQ